MEGAAPSAPCCVEISGAGERASNRRDDAGQICRPPGRMVTSTLTASKRSWRGAATVPAFFSACRLRVIGASSRWRTVGNRVTPIPLGFPPPARRPFSAGGTRYGGDIAMRTDEFIKMRWFTHRAASSSPCRYPSATQSNSLRQCHAHTKRKQHDDAPPTRGSVPSTPRAGLPPTVLEVDHATHH